MAQWVKNLTDIHEDVRLLPGLAQGVKDLVLLWLWYRLVVTTLIRPLAWESPYAAGAAIKRKKKRTNNPNLQDRLLEHLKLGFGSHTSIPHHVLCVTQAHPDPALEGTTMG